MDLDHVSMIRMNGGLYAPTHDPRFAEIEQIMGEVGIKFIQVVAYATEHLPQGTTPETAACVCKNFLGGYDYRLLININACKNFTISTEIISDVYILPRPARMFNIHDNDFFLELARYLREERVLSLPKYELVRFKLWWNK